MGAAESTPKIELRKDIPLSPNPFFNNVFNYLTSEEPLPQSFIDAIEKLSSDENLFTKKALDKSIDSFVLDENDLVWIEIAKGLVHHFPNIDVNVRSKLVPGRIKEHVFWRRFLWQLQRTLRKSYDKELDVAVRAVKKACQVCVAVHKQLVEGDTLTKDDKSPVTVADFSSQAIIINELMKAFPDDPVIGEEDAAALRGDSDAAKTLKNHVVSLTRTVVSEMEEEDILNAIDRGQYEGGAQGRHWTLDPIDGTKGFLRGEQYAVCLALIEDGEVVVGVLGCPHFPVSRTNDEGEAENVAPGCLLAAAVGCGANMGILGQPLTEDVNELGWRLAVSTESNPAKARITESVESGHSSHTDAAQIAALLGTTIPSLRMDSQCKYAAVARGDASVYLRLPTRPGYVEKVWDHASGTLLVHESGGTVTDVRGRPLDFSRGRGLSGNLGVVATNGLLHSRVLAAVRAVLFPVTPFYVQIEGKTPPSEEALRRAIASALKLDVDCVAVEIADDDTSLESSVDDDDNDNDVEDKK